MSQALKYFLFGWLVSLVLLIMILFLKFFLFHKSDNSVKKEQQIESFQPSPTNTFSYKENTAEPSKFASEKNSSAKKKSCPEIPLPQGYTIANNSDIYGFFSDYVKQPYPLVFKIDFNGDGRKEEVRVLVESIQGEDPYPFRKKPVIIQVIGEDNGCLQEVFRFGKSTSEKPGDFGWRNGNEIGYASAIADFWGDARDVFVFIPVSTGYGSGYIAFLNILAFKDGRYQVIEGPVLDELDNFEFSTGAAPGRVIWVGRGIWSENEPHFGEHVCKIEKWIWQEEVGRYEKIEFKTTKGKHADCKPSKILEIK